jgi:hypothetical protein
VSSIPRIAVPPSAPDAVALAHARLLKDASLQFGFSGVPSQSPPDWFWPIIRFLKFIEPGLEILFWCVVAGLVALLVYVVGRELWLRRWPQKRERAHADSAAAQWRPTRAEAEHLLSDADALAESGNYGDAVHLILLRSIQDIDKHRPAAVKPASTSREIARLGALPDSARSAFATIARVVERSLFGGDAVAAADFKVCRAEYERFAFSDAWGARR